MKRPTLAAAGAAVALAAAVTFVGLSAQAQTDPPPADMCAPGFIVTTIAGSVSCQPEPRVVVTMPPVVVEGVETDPAPEPAPAPAPKVEPAPPAPEAPPACVP